MTLVVSIGASCRLSDDSRSISGGRQEGGEFSGDGPAQATGPLTFATFASIYIERYVKANGLASADTIEYRMAPTLDHFGSKTLEAIKTADVDFVAKLKQPGRLARNQNGTRRRRPATINRYLSTLRHMFNWAIGREYIEGSPFRRGTQTLIRRSRKSAISSATRPS